jgi:uncharacterized protein with ParB-like and HNH nuclease domain
MRTSADNRRVRQILNSLQNGELIPRPDFQRQLVWSNRDKIAFLDTVLKGYPFPEIYVAVGEVDLVTAEGVELLVDGQQRITTLHQYFSASPSLKIQGGIPAYVDLLPDQKTEFLNYEIAVRNLGIISPEEIIEVFRRINATSYALNDIEIHNALYRGPLMQAATEISTDEFFSRHRSFSAQEMRRKRDVVYTLTILISMMSTYFHRDEELENYLQQYNDEFPEENNIKKRFARTRDFIEKAKLTQKSRAWKKTDLLALFVEIDRLLNKERVDLDHALVGNRINLFYVRVEGELKEPTGDDNLQAYIRTTRQATNDRASRVNRGRVLRKAILGEI